MFADLSSNQLLMLGAIAGIILVIILLRLYKRAQVFFKPFKKGKSYWCRVSAVSDGDTLTCYRLNLRRSKTKIRFAYIDAPESSQEYGKESEKLVKKLVYRKFVRVRITDVDRYGRCVAVVHRIGTNVNEELVKRGAAWVYEEYISNATQRQHWLALQAKAKKQKKGLWQNSKAIRPKTYRKQSKA
jgi:micrococcal nuclease